MRNKNIVLSLLLCLCSVSVQADYLETLKEAPIRADSLSSTPIIDRITGGTYLVLLGDRTYGTGYWKVQLPSGETGYVYKTHVRKIEGTIPGGEPAPAETVSGNMEVHMINVGQADAILIICPHGTHQLVIDSGDLNSGFRYPGSTTEFKNYISWFQNSDDPIEVVVSSHPHSDHIAGMSWLLQNYPVGLYIDNGRVYDSGTYRSLETIITDNTINRKQLTDVEIPDIDFCPLESVNAMILRPTGYDDLGSDENEYSVVVRVEYGSASFLFTGDAEHNMEERLVADPNTNGYLDVDFLKVGHHGSESSSTSDFLRSVSPEIAAISSGGEELYTNKGYSHPRQKTIDSLLIHVGERTGIKTTLEGYNDATEKWVQTITDRAIYITNNEGDLVFLSDGNDIWKLGDQE